MPHHHKRTSPLFDLPPELRNTIYEFVLTGPWQTLRIPLDRPALLKVCKQITAEASPIFFDLNDCCATVTTANVKRFSQCLSSFGREGASAMKHLTLLLDLDAEVQLNNASEFGGAGVLNYPRWFWVEVPRIVVRAGVRADAVSVATPSALTWTMDVVQYAERWVGDMQDGLFRSETGD